MVAVYVVSSEAYSGKTLTCLALGTRWRRRGLRVGYLKPVGLMPVVVGEEVTDEDVPFLAQQLDLEPPFARMCPVILGPALGRERPEELRARVKEAYAAGAEGRDVMLIGGLGPVLTCGSAFGLSAPEIADTIDAKVILVTRSTPTLVLDNVVAARRALGDRLVGVIFNRVEEADREYLADCVLPGLEGRGIRVLGAVPDDSLLSSVTIGEIARATGSEVLYGEGHAGQLVENLVVGAMGVEAALRYFRRIARKCVITGGDRIDLQFAALETSTRCLVLTGSLRPNHRVLARAEELSIPVLLAAADTLTTVATIEQLIGKQRIKEQTKVDHARAQFEAALDLDGLDAVLGLTRAPARSSGAAPSAAA